MQPLSKYFIHSSKELALQAFENPNYVIAVYHDLRLITREDYLDFLKHTGDFLSEHETGRLLADFSTLKNFSLELRATAINNFRRLIADRIPYLLLAIVKPKALLEDFTLDVALDLAKPLSRKFIDGQIFYDEKEALNWLVGYPIRKELATPI